VSDRRLATRRRRRRTAQEALVLIAVTILLLWGADRLAEAGAESLLERNIQDVTGVIDPPLVDVHRPPFLPQAIRGAYHEVEVSVTGIRSGALRVHRVDAMLYDVRMPFGDLLLRDIRTVGIGRSTEQVTLRFEDLNAYFEITGRSLRLSGSDGDTVEMTGSLDVLGQAVPVTARVDLLVDGSRLRLVPQDVDIGDTSLSQARRLLLNQRLNLTVPLDTLPFGHQLTDVTVDEQELRISAGSTAVILRP
jgi:hypothetical protein